MAWTSQGAIDLGELAEHQLEARLRGELLEVFSVDKFPKMTDYVVPSGVRIADSARIRLGAYIGEGTTVMHEGFVNFNAGTEGHTVESGLYVTAGTKVALLDENNQLVKVVKARDLAGQTDLLFRRNSETGAVECKTHKSAIELNEALHAHN